MVEFADKAEVKARTIKVIMEQIGKCLCVAMDSNESF